MRGSVRWLLVKLVGASFLAVACAPIAGTVAPGAALETASNTSIPIAGPEDNDTTTANASPSPATASGNIVLPIAEGAHRLILANRCNTTVWASDGNAMYLIAPNDRVQSSMPKGFGGRIWARNDCAVGATGAVACSIDIPLTWAEFKLDGYAGLDFYDVSLVDAFNLPLSITPEGGRGDCRVAACAQNLLLTCPDDLQTRDPKGQLIACLSGCAKHPSDAACCANSNATPATCPAPPTAAFFKKACPDAYSYAYDDGSSTRTCTGPTGYTVTFCPGA